jgi:hypothetical protein
VDLTKPFIPYMPVLPAESVPLGDIQPGDWVISPNRKGDLFYRLVKWTDLSTIHFDPYRWVGGPGSSTDGKCDWHADKEVPNAFSCPYAGAKVGRIPALAGVHVAYALHLAKAETHERMDTLVDGRSVSQVARHVHSSGDLLIRYIGEDEFHRIPVHSIAVLKPTI